MDENNEKYALEFSRVAKMNGMFPLHIDTLSRAGRPPHHWRIIYIGTHEQVWAKCEEVAKRLKL